MAPRTFVIDRRLLPWVLLGVVALLLVVLLPQVLLLAFAGIIVAILLRALSDLLHRWIHVGVRWSLAISVLIAFAVIAGFAVLFGTQVAMQVSDLLHSLPELADEAGARLGVSGFGGQAKEALQQFWNNGLSSLANYTSSAVAVLGSALVVLVGGIYMAIDAERYRDGLMQILPPPARPKGLQVLAEISRVLRLWLLGQLVAMVVVGLATGLGLWLLDIPSAAALGVLAGLLEFIPFAGPILAWVAALLIGLSQGLLPAVWVSLLYLVIQQLESNLLIPMIQQRTVDLPPALGLFALIAIGALFGPLGVLLAVPLTVVVMVATKQLYIRDMLQQETDIPGERRPE